MLVGVTDIVTGASHIQHPSNKNFTPKLRPKQTYHQASGSNLSCRSSTDAHL